MNFSLGASVNERQIILGSSRINTISIFNEFYNYTASSALLFAHHESSLLMRNTMPVIDNPNFSNFLAPGARRFISNNSGRGASYFQLFSEERRIDFFLDLCSDIESSSITMFVAEFNRRNGRVFANEFCR